MKKALLISPPVYDTQYWERWSLPHGLLKVATHLKRHGYQIKLVDCLLGDEKGLVRKKHMTIVQVGTGRRRVPNSWSERVKDDEKALYCFGKSIEELEKEFQECSLFDEDEHFWTPDEVWITSIMTYWWESTHDVVAVCKKYFPKARIRVGGIYPTLAPEHAEKNLGLDSPLVISGGQLNLSDEKQMACDLIVTGEIPEANDLELDLDLYPDRGNSRPKYTILTTSRGCPRDCEYCAAYVLSGRKVRARDVNSVIDEIRAKYTQGIREFCFYEDNLLMAKKNFKEILTCIIEDKDLKGIGLHSPEGLEIRLVDPELAKLMKAAGFRRVYLPLETIDYQTIAQWGRDFYTLKDFERAVRIFEDAGFTKPQQINVFVLFGLPGEDLQHVYDTAIYAATRTGSVIPMLFASVPGTPLFKKFEDYFAERGFDLHDLNGKLLPFLEYNRRVMKNKYDLTSQDYYDVEAFMFRLNEKVRERTFRPGAENRISISFREVFTNYRSVFDRLSSKKYRPAVSVGSGVHDWITEYHGTGKSLITG